MKLVRLLLFPFVPLYFIATWLRNLMFDYGILKSEQFKIPIICVGNLSTGGTGKTPMVEYLVRLLHKHVETAVLSRGYKRKSKGFVLANDRSTFLDIGDEPFQFHSKFKSINVAVDEKRSNGIEQLQLLKPKLGVIILDDAFQHRHVKAGFNVLLSAYSNPFYKDIVLPTGNLREPRSGYKRADAIVITKCPKDITKEEKHLIADKIKLQAHQSLFFSSITYSSMVINENEEIELSALKNFSLITGIANPDPLLNYLKAQGCSFDHKSYPDHYEFKSEDIKALQQKSIIITTEKDFVRLSKTELTKTNKVYYLPIEFNLDKPEEFNELVMKFVN